MRQLAAHGHPQQGVAVQVVPDSQSLTAPRSRPRARVTGGESRQPSTTTAQAAIRIASHRVSPSRRFHAKQQLDQVGDDQWAAGPRFAAGHPPRREQLTDPVDAEQDASSDTQTEPLTRHVGEVQHRQNDVRKSLHSHDQTGDREQRSGRLGERFWSVITAPAYESVTQLNNSPGSLPL